MCRGWGALILVTVVACAMPVGPVGELSDLPGQTEAHDQRAWQARRLFEAGRSREALGVLTAILDEAPDYVDAHRVRQDIMRERGRMSRLLWESEQRLERSPDAATAHYLAGRLARTDDEKLAWFRRATDLAPGSFWGWLGTAFVMRGRKSEEALAIYKELYDASDGHPVAAIALASMLRTSDASSLGYPADGTRYREALMVYDGLREHPLVPGVGELGLAQTLFQRDKMREAWPALMRAAKLRPFDAGVHGLIRQFIGRGLPLDQLEQMVDVLRQDGSRMEQLARSGGATVLAGLLAKAGLPFAARSVLENDDGSGPVRPVPRRQWQRLLLRTGDVRAFLASVRRGFPSELLVDERNQVRGLFAQLFDGPWMDAEDPLHSPGVVADLAEALLRAGYVDGASQICDMALLRHAAAQDSSLERLRERRDEARKQLSFERSVRRVVYHGYARPGSAQGLDDVLADLRRISLEIFGRDVVGEPDRLTVPFVGQLLDSFAPGLFEHLARYNHHLVLGQLGDRSPEGMMLRRLSVRDLEPSEELPLARPAMEIVGENRSIRTLSGVYGGDLAGVALINHTVIDMDSVREWADGIRERREIVREDGGAMLDDPLPRNSGALAPASVHWRLSMMSPVGDNELDMAVLDMIRWHERAHLVDTMHFLPIESNVWRVLGLLFGHAFSRASIEAEVEARAEVASLALSAHTRLVLAHIAVFLEGEASGSPHAMGFRRLAERLGRLLREAGLPDAASHWHLLDPDVVRRLARELLREQW